MLIFGSTARLRPDHQALADRKDGRPALPWFDGARHRIAAYADNAIAQPAAEQPAKTLLVQSGHRVAVDIIE